MTPPRKNSLENLNHDFDTQHYFSDFQRIQIKKRQPAPQDDFRSLSLQERINLMEKLIDRVKDL